MSLSNQVTVGQRSGKSRASNGSTPSGQFRVKLKSPQTSLIDSYVKSIFSQNRALNAISMASGRARPTVLSSYATAYKAVIQLASSHILSRWLTFSATTRLRSMKETPFSRRTNEDKLTTKQLGLP